MKLGDVLKKERERKGLPEEVVAGELSLDVDEYRELESGESQIEEWGQKLAQIAIKLATPTSRLISETGKAAQARQIEGQCAKLIKAHRERRRLGQQELAERLGMPVEEIVAIENGRSPLEAFAPLLLRFAELIDQPIFNLFYPCGLPLEKLEDYP